MKSVKWWAENWENHSLIKEEIKSRSDARKEESNVDQAQEAKSLIKQAHSSGGRILTNAELTEFINAKFNLGRPKPYKLNTRGRPVRKTQYDLAFERRRGFYQRLVRLPAGVRNDTGEHVIGLIKDLFDRVEEQSVPKRQQVGRVAELLTAMGIQPPEVSYLYKIRKRPIKG